MSATPLPAGEVTGSLPCAGVHVIHALNVSVTCAVSEHLHGQALEFGRSGDAAEREDRITTAGEAANQEERSWPRPPVIQQQDQRTELIKEPSGGRLKVFVQAL